MWIYDFLKRKLLRILRSLFIGNFNILDSICSRLSNLLQLLPPSGGLYSYVIFDHCPGYDFNHFQIGNIDFLLMNSYSKESLVKMKGSFFLIYFIFKIWLLFIDPSLIFQMKILLVPLIPKANLSTWKDGEGFKTLIPQIISLCLKTFHNQWAESAHKKWH